jgi:two-component system chemotaxis response regulator CheB
VTQPIRVLLVDDSALVRKVLTELLTSDPEIEVMGAATDPFAAAELIRQEEPDVLVLDVEMPRMDGITFLKRLMRQHPIPTVVCSSLVGTASASALAALEAGAVELIEKPQAGLKEFFEESRQRLIHVVKAAASAKVRRVLPAGAAVGAREARTKPRRPITPDLQISPKLSADVMLKPPVPRAMLRTTDRVVVIGASTGGTEALREVLVALPADAPPIVIVQHMPEGFTRAFAGRLDSLAAITIKEAAHGDVVVRSQALIAPGNRHMLLRRSGARYHVEVLEGPLVSRHRPSVDVLFRSAAESAGPNAVGVILTGMGDDGAQGLLEMRQAGATTIGQDEPTCVVYGMPGEAKKRGAVEHELPLGELARALMRYA